MHLGYINGATEGVFCVAVFFIMSGIVGNNNSSRCIFNFIIGPSFWTETFFMGIQNNLIVVYLFLVIAMVTAIGK